MQRVDAVRECCPARPSHPQLPAREREALIAVESESGTQILACREPTQLNATWRRAVQLGQRPQLTTTYGNAIGRRSGAQRRAAMQRPSRTALHGQTGGVSQVSVG